MANRGEKVDGDRSALLGVVPSTVLVALGCVFTIGIVEIIVQTTDYSFRYFSVDPASTLGALPLIGLLSHVGVLVLWGAGAASMFAGAFVARARGWRPALPLVLAGGGAAYVALDDLFMLHDWAYTTKIGLTQDLVIAVYAVVFAAFLWRYRELFSRNEWPLLALAVGTLALSVVFDTDVAELFARGTRRRLEDGLKLFGYAFLALYVVRLSLRMMTEAYPLARSADQLQAAPDTASHSRG